MHHTAYVKTYSLSYKCVCRCSYLRECVSGSEREKENKVLKQQEIQVSGWNCVSVNHKYMQIQQTHVFLHICACIVIISFSISFHFVSFFFICLQLLSLNEVFTRDTCLRHTHTYTYTHVNMH